MSEELENSKDCTGAWQRRHAVIIIFTVVIMTALVCTAVVKGSFDHEKWMTDHEGHYEYVTDSEGDTEIHVYMDYERYRYDVDPMTNRVSQVDEFNFSRVNKKLIPLYLYENEFINYIERAGITLYNESSTE